MFAPGLKYQLSTEKYIEIQQNISKQPQLYSINSPTKHLPQVLKLSGPESNFIVQE